MGKKRNDYIDIVKGITIVLVVIGHCIQFGSGKAYFLEGGYFSNPVFKFIYSFHMPLFMLVSGYLFYYSINRDVWTIIKSKFIGIILPLISWHTLYQFICIINGDHISFRVFFLSYFHTLWFLRALFYSCLLILFINRLFKDNIIAYVIIFVAMLFIPDHRLPAIFVFTIPYFYLGYLFNKTNGIHFINMQPITKKNFASFTISFIFVLLLLFFKDNYYAYLTKTCLFNRDYTLYFMLFVDTYRYFTALLGCICILIVLWRLHLLVNGFFISKTIIFFSKISLCIYIINHYLNETILLELPINSLNYGHIIVETTSILLLAWAIYHILNANRVLRLLFLGGRGQ